MRRGMPVAVGAGMGAQKAYLVEALDVPPSQRPTALPPPMARAQSGVRPRADGGFRDPRPTPAPARVDLRWIPLVVDRRPLLIAPRMILSMLVTCMNGVLTVADLSEVTGIPLGAVMDNLLELQQRGVIVFHDDGR